MKILIADDDKIERTALRELIGEQPNLEIVEVENGQAALDALCDGLNPDLCIFDIRMPQLDGVELLARMRRDPRLRSLKVVMTSATRDREIILGLAKLQISGYLLKPYDVEKSRAILQPLFATSMTNPLLASRNLLAKTALIIDDDDSVRTILEAVIRKESGWEVVNAKGGIEALALLHRGLRPDLIIVDLIMPGLDGVSFLTRVREDPHLRFIKTVAISATPEREKILALAALGVRTFLGKPVEQEKVVAVLRAQPGAAETEAGKA